MGPPTKKKAVAMKNKRPAPAALAPSQRKKPELCLNPIPGTATGISGTSSPTTREQQQHGQSTPSSTEQEEKDEDKEDDGDKDNNKKLNSGMVDHSTDPFHYGTYSRCWFAYWNKSYNDLVLVLT